MRSLAPLLMILLAGCSTMGFGPRSGLSRLAPETACEQSCEGLAECPGDPAGESSKCGGCGNWLCAHGMCLHGHHPHYRRLPDNMRTKHEARKLAQSALRKEGRNQCLSCDYRLGYEQAFVDISLGACGDVPALPPANYWKTCARTPDGHQKAQQWFSGYAAGAVRANAIYEPFNEVAHSQFDCPGWEGSRLMNGDPSLY